MMDAAAKAKELLRSPQFSLFYRKLQTALAEEAARRERFYDEIDEDTNAEFIAGQVVMHSPIRLEHDIVSGGLFLLLRAYVQKFELGHVGHERVMICLTRNDFEPDVCFFGKEKTAAFVSGQLKFPAPDFIAEVLSPSTAENDRGVKFADYAAHGVGEYWIVDADKRFVEQYLLDGDEYRFAGKWSGDDLIHCRAVSGFQIPAVALFDPQQNSAALARFTGGGPQ